MNLRREALKEAEKRKDLATQLEESQATIEKLRKSLRRKDEEIEQLDAENQLLNDQIVKLNESDLKIQRLEKEKNLLTEKLEDLAGQKERWQKTAKEAKRDSEIAISNCKERESNFDREVRKAAQSLFNEFKRPYEENIDKVKKDAQNERERLLEASEQEASRIRAEAEADREKAAQLKRRSGIIAICCILIGVIAGIGITNRVLDKAHVTKIAKQKAQIEELKATIEDKDKLLAADYYIYKGAAWTDTLTLKAKKGDGEVTFYGGECIRLVKGGGLSDSVVLYNGKKYVISWTDLMSGFSKIHLP